MNIVVKENTPSKFQPYEKDHSLKDERKAGYISLKRHRSYHKNWEISPETKLFGTKKRFLEFSNIFNELFIEIEKSKYILDLEDDYDDEGAESYSKEIWEKSTQFLISNAKNIYKQESKIIDVPSIFHGPDGSIDILWQKEDYRLLINIDKNEIVSFYGDYYREAKKIKGEEKLDQVKSNFLQFFLCQ